MKIIAHRGYWKETSEKNSMEAFKRAFLNGYGVETDFRDYKGELVISHDIANEESVSAEDFFELYSQCGQNNILAINIKADGIQKLLQKYLEEYQVTNYFVFDMSVPEMVIYHHQQFKYLTRRSDIENETVLFADAQGVWLDAFYKDRWGMAQAAKEILSQRKLAVMVSPELHGRDKNGLWDELKQKDLCGEDRFYLCTDCPKEAEAVFGGQGNEM